MSTSRNYSDNDSTRKAQSTAQSVQRPEAVAQDATRTRQVAAAVPVDLDRSGIEFERVRGRPNPLPAATIAEYRAKFGLT